MIASPQLPPATTTWKQAVLFAEQHNDDVAASNPHAHMQFGPNYCPGAPVSGDAPLVRSRDPATRWYRLLYSVVLSIRYIYGDAYVYGDWLRLINERPRLNPCIGHIDVEVPLTATITSAQLYYTLVRCSANSYTQMYIERGVSWDYTIYVQTGDTAARICIHVHVGPAPPDADVLSLRAILKPPQKHRRVCEHVIVGSVSGWNTSSTRLHSIDWSRASGSPTNTILRSIRKRVCARNCDPCIRDTHAHRFRMEALTAAKYVITPAPACTWVNCVNASLMTKIQYIRDKMRMNTDLIAELRDGIEVILRPLTAADVFDVCGDDGVALISGPLSTYCPGDTTAPVTIDTCPSWLTFVITYYVGKDTSQPPPDPSTTDVFAETIAEVLPAVVRTRDIRDALARNPVETVADAFMSRVHAQDAPDAVARLNTLRLWCQQAYTHLYSRGANTK